MYIFDLITCPAIMGRGLLSTILESRDVVKVIEFKMILFFKFLLIYDISLEKVCHDCKNDSAALAISWNVNLANVFDTQVSQSVEYITAGQLSLRFFEFCFLFICSLLVSLAVSNRRPVSFFFI